MAVPTVGQDASRNSERSKYLSVNGGLGNLVQDRTLASVLAEGGRTRGTNASTRALSEVFARSIFVAFGSDYAGGSVSYRKLSRG